MELAHIPGSTTTNVRVTPERLFGRHCAVLGATGGGKSWTLARIVERCAAFNAKVLLLDATGEYHRLSEGVEHVSIGTPVDRPDACTPAALPYTALAEEDLFAMFRPAGQVQAPRLRSAMKSLKLAALASDEGLVEDGCIPKSNRPRAPFDEAYAEHAGAVDAPSAEFDIEKLAEQSPTNVYGRRHGESDVERRTTPSGAMLTTKPSANAHR